MTCYSQSCQKEVPLTSEFASFCNLECRKAYWKDQDVEIQPVNAPKRRLTLSEIQQRLYEMAHPEYKLDSSPITDTVPS